MPEPDATTSQEDADPTRLDPPDPAQHFGAAAAADAEIADRVTEEAGDDLDRAESEFDEASQGPAPTATAHPRE